MKNATISLSRIIAGILVLAAPSPAADLVPLEGLAAAELTRYWQVTLPLAKDEELIAIHQVDEHLYGVTDLAVVFAIDADTGLIRWAQQPALPEFRVFAPTHRVSPDGERQVVIGTGRDVRLFELRYGDARGRVPLPFAPSTPAVADAERVYIGSLNGRYYAYRIDDGVRIWQVRTRGPISSRPLLHGDELCIASQGGRVYAAGSRDKVQRWVTDLGAVIHGDLAVGGKLVYAAAEDRYVYAMDRALGTKRWRRQLPAVLIDGPILAGDTLYQLADDAGVAALDPARGEIRWSRAGTFQFLARGPSRVYLRDAAGQGVVLDNTTGQELARFASGAVELTLANPHDETLFFADRIGVVMCVRRTGAPALARGRRAVAAAARPQPGAATRPAVAAAGTPPRVPNPVDAILADPLRSRSAVDPLTKPSASPSAGNP
jgi:outer membrane protein assembly factor BamB